jgi:hypothetical protein
MVEWERVPWSLWAYAAVTLLGVALVEVTAHGPVAVKLMFAAFMLAWLYGLLLGVRWVWVGSVGIYVLGLAPEVASGSLDWQGVALSLVGLLLLVLPVTWHYFLDESPA